MRLYLAVTFCGDCCEDQAHRRRVTPTHGPARRDRCAVAGGQVNQQDQAMGSASGARPDTCHPTQPAFHVRCLTLFAGGIHPLLVQNTANERKDGRGLLL